MNRNRIYMAFFCKNETEMRRCRKVFAISEHILLLYILLQTIIWCQDKFMLNQKFTCFYQINSLYHAIFVQICSKKFFGKSLDNPKTFWYNRLSRLNKQALFGGIAQLARACGSYPQCRWFKSDYRYQVASEGPCRGSHSVSFYGALVKRLRHGPFTAVTRVRLSYGSPHQY